MDSSNVQGKARAPISSHIVVRAATPPVIDADWDKPFWKQTIPVQLDEFMGPRPDHMPKTQAKVAYDDSALYVIFRVEDRFVRSVMTNNQSPVCTDSCAEFFFSPAPALPNDYFNLELNCGGAMYFAYNNGNGETKMSNADMAALTVAHSMPAVVDPEVTTPVTWTIEYRLPLHILTKYCPIVQPAPGVAWRANFYKCADKTSHPHWLTWARVENPYPRFHLPAFFGRLEFE
ncbi:MAG: carbohydrate-binding family 9-like protein [bacterium]